MSFRKGNIPWNKGKPTSKKTRKNLSKAHKGILPWNTGLTKETDKRVAKMELSKSKKSFL